MVNMKALTSGVLHTKFWIVDKKHVYIGSANMDWRSLTQVQTHSRSFDVEEDPPPDSVCSEETHFS